VCVCHPAPTFNKICSRPESAGTKTMNGNYIVFHFNHFNMQQKF